MQYVGSRYVPKFMGAYDVTQVYEALCVVDNGLGTSYISKKPTPAGTALTDTEYWAVYGASSGAIINLQNQIDDINTEISNFITPDDFTGSDTQKLQAAFDCFDGTFSGVIIINRKYEITSDIEINHFAGTASDSYITVIGLGKEATINLNSNSIKAGALNYMGGVKFENVHFKGTGTAFNTNQLIRMNFINCRFENFNIVFDCDTLTQQYNFNNCYFEENNIVFNLNNTAVYGLNSYQCDFEHNDIILKSDNDSTISYMIFDGCVIELCTSYGLKFNGKMIRCTSIEKCYFEGNPISIDLSQVISGQYCDCIRILGNVFNLPNNGIGILIPNTTYKLSSFNVQKLVIIRDNFNHPNTNSNTELISINGTPNILHGIWYDIDCYAMGYNETSDLFKATYQYDVKFAQFTYTLANSVNAGDVFEILTAADLATLTGTSTLQIIIQCRNGYFPAVYTRDPNTGKIFATMISGAAAGSYTFTIAYNN